MEQRVATKEEWAWNRARVSKENLPLFDAGNMPVVTKDGVRLLPPGSTLSERVTRDLPNAIVRSAPRREETSSTAAPPRTESPAEALRSSREAADKNFQDNWHDETFGTEPKNAAPYAPEAERATALAHERAREERRVKKEEELARIARGELTETERAIRSFNDL